MDAAAIEWDVVIVGTGMGGATLGYTLAKAGKRVLFVERGLESPFFGLHSDRIEQFRPEVQFIELADGVRLNVDAQAKRFDVGNRFKDDARYTNLMEGVQDFV